MISAPPMVQVVHIALGQALFVPVAEA